MSVMLLNGNALSIPLADNSVHCAICSPPYWGLRSYGIGTDNGELGLEPTPELYVAHMVAVFREVRRVLRDDGTLFLNLGDSYNGSGGAGGDYNDGGLKEGQPRYPGRKVGTLKPKDLVGIPWRVAFALQADGWWLRSDIIWHKPNPMPESVTDRPTKAHEYLFLLAKSANYYYDADAVREPLQTDPQWLEGAFSGKWAKRTDGKEYNLQGSGMHKAGASYAIGLNPAGRNRRTVWNIATAPYSGAHFATFPPALVEPCIKAGTSERGVCPKCGAPWERVISREEPTFDTERKLLLSRDDRKVYPDGRKPSVSHGRPENSGVGYSSSMTIGWRPGCNCSGNDPIPAIVLDPFAGSGTTLLVARQLGRHGIGLDLSLPYLRDQARERLSLTALDEWTSGKKDGAVLTDLPLFGGGA